MTVYGLTTDALRALGRAPRLHPNGFIQLDLSDPVDEARGHSGAMRRLHVWPFPYIHDPGPDDTPIHDHVFDMRSDVALGQIFHTEYELDLAHDGHPTHEVWIPRYEGAHKSVLHPTGVAGVLRETLIRDFRADSEWLNRRRYTQRAHTFHTSAWKALSATYMTKTAVHGGFDCRVLVECGRRPPAEKADRNRVPEGTLWEIIDEALGQIRRNA